MEFTQIANTEEIPIGAMKSFTVHGTPILITNVEGHYFAIENECTHAGKGLEGGSLIGKIVTCPQRGSQFDVTTGACKKGPAFRNVATFEVRIENGKIKVGV